MNADGKEVEVDMETVEDRLQGLSAMPEDLMKFMSPRDLRDVIEFLSAQRQAVDGAPASGADEGGHKLEN